MNEPINLSNPSDYFAFWDEVRSAGVAFGVVVLALLAGINVWLALIWRALSR